MSDDSCIKSIFVELLAGAVAAAVFAVAGYVCENVKWKDDRPAQPAARKDEDENGSIIVRTRDGRLIKIPMRGPIRRN